MTRAKALFVALAIALALFSIMGGGEPFLRILAAAAFAAGAWVRRGTGDDLLFTLATGELLVIAVAAASFYAGFFVQCAVIGAALTSGATPVGRRDAPVFTGFFLLALGGAVVLDQSNKLLPTFLALILLILAAAFVITGVTSLRERRKYAGGNP